MTEMDNILLYIQKIIHQSSMVGNWVAYSNASGITTGNTVIWANGMLRSSVCLTRHSSTAGNTNGRRKRVSHCRHNSPAVSRTVVSADRSG